MQLAKAFAEIEVDVLAYRVAFIERYIGMIHFTEEGSYLSLGVAGDKEFQGEQSGEVHDALTIARPL